MKVREHIKIPTHFHDICNKLSQYTDHGTDFLDLTTMFIRSPRILYHSLQIMPQQTAAMKLQSCWVPSFTFYCSIHLTCILSSAAAVIFKQTNLPIYSYKISQYVQNCPNSGSVTQLIFKHVLNFHDHYDLSTTVPRDIPNKYS